MSHIFGQGVDFNYNETFKFRSENAITFPTLTASEKGFTFFHTVNEKFYGWTGTSWLDFGLSGGGGAVDSFIGRTGAVVATAGDYDAFYYTEAEVDAGFVNLSTSQSIGGLKSFTSAIHAQSGQMIFNDDASPTGYASGGAMGYLGASQYYFFQDHANIEAAAGIFDFDGLTVTDKTYTWPNKSGTVAMLDDAGTISDAAYGVGWNGNTTDGASKNAIYDAMVNIAETQTITGIKLFSAIQTSIQGIAQIYGTGAQLNMAANTGSDTAYTSGYARLFVRSSDDAFSFNPQSSGTDGWSFTSANTARRDYALPDKAGTVALLDDVGFVYVTEDPAQSTLTGVQTAAIIKTITIPSDSAPDIGDTIRIRMYGTGGNSAGSCILSLVTSDVTLDNDFFNVSNTTSKWLCEYTITVRSGTVMTWYRRTDYASTTTIDYGTFTDTNNGASIVFEVQVDHSSATGDTDIEGYTVEIIKA